MEIVSVSVIHSNKLCNFHDVLSVTDRKASHRFRMIRCKTLLLMLSDGKAAGGKALLVVIKCLKGLNRKVDDTAEDSHGHI